MTHFLYFFLGLGVNFGVHSRDLFTKKLNQKVNNRRILFVKIATNITERLNNRCLKLENVENSPCRLLRGFNGIRNRVKQGLVMRIN